MPPLLRPYQSECVEKCLEALGKGIRRQAVSLPVGSGKTVIFSNLIERIPPPTPTATKALVLAHREELLDQAAARISAAHSHLVVDVDQGRRGASQLADVIIASIPTLGRVGSRRLSAYDPSRFKAIIVDEAHHVAAASYLRVLDHFKVREATSPILLWGCSATLRRHDGLGLGRVFDAITYHRNMLELMKDGYLAPMRVFTVRTHLDLSNISVSSSSSASPERDFVLAQLAAAVNTPARNALIVEQWHKLARSAGRRSTIVFAVDIQHIQDLVAAFRAAGATCEGVDGRTSSDARSDVLRRFSAGEISVLVNCGVFTEGTDIPSIDCVVMARPTRSSVLFQQMVGRGLRTAPDKDDCLVIDMVDSFRKKSFVTAPSLLGLDPDFVMDGSATLADYRKGANAQSIDGNSASKSNSASNSASDSVKLVARVSEIDPFEQPFDTAGATSGSPLAWMQFEGKDGLPEYVLAADMSTSVVVRRREKGPSDDTDPDDTKGAFRVVLRRMVKTPAGGKFYRVQELPITAASAADAIRSADTYVQSKFGDMRTAYMRRDARWRLDRASPQQVAYLRRLGVARFRSEEQIAAMTKEEAARIIAGITAGYTKRHRVDMERERREQAAVRAAAAQEPHMDDFGSETVWLGGKL